MKNVDMPPGTADVAHVLTRELKISGAIVVVTPQEVATSTRERP